MIFFSTIFFHRICSNFFFSPFFQGFLSTQQQCLHLEHEALPSTKKDNNSHLLICETKDFVEIGIRSDVFYRIVDAAQALLVIGKDNIQTLVRETAIATLNSIIRSTSLAEIAQNKEINGNIAVTNSN